MKILLLLLCFLQTHSSRKDSCSTATPAPMESPIATRVAIMALAHLPFPAAYCLLENYPVNAHLKVNVNTTNECDEQHQIIELTYQFTKFLNQSNGATMCELANLLWKHIVCILNPNTQQHDKETKQWLSSHDQTFITQTTEKKLFMEQCIAIGYWLFQNHTLNAINVLRLQVLKFSKNKKLEQSPITKHLMAIFGLNPNNSDFEINMQEAITFAFQLFIFATELAPTSDTHIPFIRRHFLTTVAKDEVILQYAIEMAQQSIPNTDFFTQLKNTKFTAQTNSRYRFL